MSCHTCHETDPFFPKFGLLVAVADGIGGHPGSSYASRTALGLLQREFYSESRIGATWDELAECMKRYLDKTQSQLASKLSEMPGYGNAGTSIAGMAMMPPDVLVIFHAGDCRVIKASGGSVKCLTVDNTPFGVGSFGAGNLAEVELAKEKAFAPGERYLICSSSLHGAGRGLSIAELGEVLIADVDIRFLSEEVALEGYKKDGSDNCTAVAVCVTE